MFPSTLNEVAQTVLVFSLVGILGLAIGSIKIKGIQLGIAGVLFSGLIFGHLGFKISPEIMGFVQEFGLILFVYTIGIQVGPGFFSSLKREGLKLNLLAATIVLLGVLVTLLLYAFAHIPLPVAVGMLSGATTNTPSLGAAQQALKEIPSLPPEMMNMPALGYAVAYPFGIIGILLTMVIIKFWFKIDPVKEADIYSQLHFGKNHKLAAVDFKVENPNLHGVLVKKIPVLHEKGLVISRVMHDQKTQVALAEMPIYLGDVLRVVGPEKKLEEVELIIGSRTKIPEPSSSASIHVKQVIVTKQDIDGKLIEDFNVPMQNSIIITRINRGEVELPVTKDVLIRLADVLTVVGKDQDIERFAKDIGNVPKQLDHPMLIPIFIGIGLGVLLGSLPLHIPGISAPVKLGLAGGPLLVAIILSQIGRIGSLTWYMSASANLMLREFGIVLFLACVGLRSGEKFFETLVQGQGFYWMACATLITFVPLVIVAFVMRLRMKINVTSLCGFLAGSMTDPPALAFANSITSSSAASIAYATVYPSVMILRVISTQLLILIFMSLK